MLQICVLILLVATSEAGIVSINVDDYFNLPNELSDANLTKTTTKRTTQTNIIGENFAENSTVVVGQDTEDLNNEIPQTNHHGESKINIPNEAHISKTTLAFVRENTTIISKNNTVVTENVSKDIPLLLPPINDHVEPKLNIPNESNITKTTSTLIGENITVHSRNQPAFTEYVNQDHNNEISVLFSKIKKHGQSKLNTSNEVNLITKTMHNFVTKNYTIASEIKPFDSENENNEIPVILSETKDRGESKPNIPNEANIIRTIPTFVSKNVTIASRNITADTENVNQKQSNEISVLLSQTKDHEESKLNIANEAIIVTETKPKNVTIASTNLSEEHSNEIPIILSQTRDHGELQLNISNGANIMRTIPTFVTKNVTIASRNVTVDTENVDQKQSNKIPVLLSHTKDHEKSKLNISKEAIIITETKPKNVTIASKNLIEDHTNEIPIILSQKSDHGELQLNISNAANIITKTTPSFVTENVTIASRNGVVDIENINEDQSNEIPVLLPHTTNHGVWKLNNIPNKANIITKLKPNNIVYKIITVASKNISEYQSNEIPVLLSKIKDNVKLKVNIPIEPNITTRNITETNFVDENTTAASKNSKIVVPGDVTEDIYNEMPQIKGYEELNQNLHNEANIIAVTAKTAQAISQNNSVTEGISNKIPQILNQISSHGEIKLNLQNEANVTTKSLTHSTPLGEDVAVVSENVPVVPVNTYEDLSNEIPILLPRKLDYGKSKQNLTKEANIVTKIATNTAFVDENAVVVSQNNTVVANNLTEDISNEIPVLLPRMPRIFGHGSFNFNISNATTTAKTTTTMTTTTTTTEATFVVEDDITVDYEDVPFVSEIITENTNYEIQSLVPETTDYGPLKLNLPQDIRQEIDLLAQNPNRSTEIITANVNIYTDHILMHIAILMSLFEMDPMAIPDVYKNFEKEIVWINYHGEMNLTVGLLWYISTIHRKGDTTIAFDPNRRNLLIDVPIAFNNLEATYNYSAYFMGLGQAGNLNGQIDTIELRIAISIDFQTYRACLESLTITKAGFINLIFSGAYVTDWIINIFSDVLSYFLHELILDTVSDMVHTEVTNVLEDVNAILQYIAHPANMEQVLTSFLKDNIDDILN